MRTRKQSKINVGDLVKLNKVVLHDLTHDLYSDLYSNIFVVTTCKQDHEEIRLLAYGKKEWFECVSVNTPNQQVLYFFERELMKVS